MRCLPILLLGICLSAAAQPEAAPTAFPEGATPLTPAALSQKLSGQTYVSKPKTDAEVRIQYRGDYAYINVGSASDSGKWRVEGSAICMEWRNFKHSCSEVRQVGDVLYVKRANNGEVMLMTVKP